MRITRRGSSKGKVEIWTVMNETLDSLVTGIPGLATFYDPDASCLKLTALKGTKDPTSSSRFKHTVELTLDDFVKIVQVVARTCVESPSVKLTKAFQANSDPQRNLMDFKTSLAAILSVASNLTVTKGQTKPRVK